MQFVCSEELMERYMKCGTLIYYAPHVKLHPICSTLIAINNFEMPA